VSASQRAYLTIRGFAVTVTFDILNSKSHQFICVPDCTEVALNSHKRFIRYSVDKLLEYDHTYVRTHARTVREQNACAAGINTVYSKHRSLEQATINI